MVPKPKILHGGRGERVSATPYSGRSVYQFYKPFNIFILKP